MLTAPFEIIGLGLARAEVYVLLFPSSLPNLTPFWANRNLGANRAGGVCGMNHTMAVSHGEAWNPGNASAAKYKMIRSCAALVAVGVGIGVDVGKDVDIGVSLGIRLAEGVDASVADGNGEGTGVNDRLGLGSMVGFGIDDSVSWGVGVGIGAAELDRAWTWRTSFLRRCTSQRKTIHRQGR
jgi:hypothetical protein